MIHFCFFELQQNFDTCLLGNDTYLTFQFLIAIISKRIPARCGVEHVYYRKSFYILGIIIWRFTNAVQFFRLIFASSCWNELLFLLLCTRRFIFRVRTNRHCAVFPLLWCIFPLLFDCFRQFSLKVFTKCFNIRNVFEPACAVCTVGYYASLSVWPPVCPSVFDKNTKIKLTLSVD